MAGSTLIPALFASVLESAIERFLALDPRSPDYLAPLAGKVIALRLTPFDYHLYLCPTESALQILARLDGRPDALLSGSPLAFARMGLSDSPRRALFAGEVRVEGDMEAARRFQNLFERLEIDWEGLVGRYIGEGLAGRLVGALRTGHAWRQDAVETLRLNIGEYLQEETRDFPATAEVDSFDSEVDVLRADVDRLEARLERLNSRLAAETSGGELR